MADNTQLNINTTSGDIIATEDIGGVKHELVIVEYSDDAGGATKVSPTNPLPVSATIDTTGLATSSKQDTGNTSLASIDSKLTNPLPINGTVTVNQGTQGIAAWPVLAAQAGTWDIRNVSGTVSLPTLAATSTKQSDGSQKSQIVDGSGNVIGATANALDINIKSGNPTTIIATQATAANLNVAAVLNAETTKVIGTVNANVNAPTTILNGKTTVSTAGSRVTLAGATTCKSVTIKALSTNTGFIYVGNSSVTSANGFQLLAGDTVSLDIADLTTVNIDSSVNGEGVSYLGNN